MEPQEVTTTPPWMGCQFKARLPPSISSGFPDSFTVPIYTPGRRETISILILLGEEKHCESKVSCQETQLTQPDLETRLLNTDSSTLTPLPPLSMLSYFQLTTINTQAQIHKLF